VIEIDVFALAIVRSQPHDVTLVGEEIDQLILPEETADCRVGLAQHLACLDRYGEVIGVTELEAHDAMRNQRRTPLGDEQTARLSRVV
jgi:hypothetical protein